MIRKRLYRIRSIQWWRCCVVYFYSFRCPFFFFSSESLLRERFLWPWRVARPSRMFTSRSSATRLLRCWHVRRLSLKRKKKEMCEYKRCDEIDQKAKTASDCNCAIITQVYRPAYAYERTAVRACLWPAQSQKSLHLRGSRIQPAKLKIMRKEAEAIV